ncbi:NADP-dependent oxidoreductase [Weissella uvarum]|uniref:NADP-dependent oxidoreductase n=1 Tax=Weissella uvarum TaxID=1479233 RepID=UPI0019612A14|nr:NADP-dependent oxidoreductase [Weissella uvarum]MCM0595521.1 NADP-dependent oxidoreductase [Weissella uvarum]
MHAVVINAYGSVDELKDAQVPVPELGADEVLIHVFVASVNPIDLKLRNGQMQEQMPFQFPAILGGDVAGEIVAVGERVSDYQVGQAVMARLDIDPTGQHGGYAEYAAVKADKLALKPTELSFEAAAGLPLAGLTAWQGIVDQLNVQSGEHVLVQAGAGGVGSMAIQIAKARGAYVATTASARNADLLLDLGADEVIDYHHQFLTEELADYDAVLDTIDHVDEGLYILKTTGKLATVVGRPTERQQQGHPQAVAYQMHPDGSELKQLAQLVEQKALQVVIDSTYPMNADGVRAAQEKSANHHAVGKLILKNEQI